MDSLVQAWLPVPRTQRKRLTRLLPKDPRESAIAIGLRYVSCTGQGLTRKRFGAGFAYFDAAGNKVRDKDIIRRIRSLVLPPAWTNVWICSSPQGHLQATGIDARGRRQYRYHPLYRQVRNQTKFSRMLEFGKVLPAIRQRVARDLKREGLGREKVLATVVRLLA